MKCLVCAFASETPVCWGCDDQARRLQLTPAELKALASDNVNTSARDLILERAIEVGLLTRETIEVVA